MQAGAEESLFVPVPDGPRLTRSMNWAAVAVDADDHFVVSSPLRPPGRLAMWTEMGETQRRGQRMGCRAFINTPGTYTYGT